MLKCIVCKKEVPEYGGVLLNADGDFACSETCKKKYLQDMDNLLNIIHDEKMLEDFVLK